MGIPGMKMFCFITRLLLFLSLSFPCFASNSHELSTDFTSLPSEIVSHICDYLDFQSFCNFIQFHKNVVISKECSFRLALDAIKSLESTNNINPDEDLYSNIEIKIMQDLFYYGVKSNMMEDEEIDVFERRAASRMMFVIEEVKEAISTPDSSYLLGTLLFSDKYFHPLWKYCDNLVRHVDYDFVYTMITFAPLSVFDNIFGRDVFLEHNELVLRPLVVMEKIEWLDLWIEKNIDYIYDGVQSKRPVITDIIILESIRNKVISTFQYYYLRGDVTFSSMESMAYQYVFRDAIKLLNQALQDPLLRKLQRHRFPEQLRLHV